MIITGDSVTQWVSEHQEGKFTPGLNPGIGIEHNGEIVGGVVYDGYNGKNINIHVASDGSKRWINREFLWFVFYYPFVQLGCSRVTGFVPSYNKAAIQFDEKVGFELETTLKDAHPLGDILIYKMTPDKCRWLRREQNGRKIIISTTTT